MESQWISCSWVQSFRKLECQSAHMWSFSTSCLCHCRHSSHHYLSACHSIIPLLACKTVTGKSKEIHSCQQLSAPHYWMPECLTPGVSGIEAMFAYVSEIFRKWNCMQISSWPDVFTSCWQDDSPCVLLKFWTQAVWHFHRRLRSREQNSGLLAKHCLHSLM